MSPRYGARPTGRLYGLPLINWASRKTAAMASGATAATTVNARSRSRTIATSAADPPARPQTKPRAAAPGTKAAANTSGKNAAASPTAHRPRCVVGRSEIRQAGCLQFPLRSLVTIITSAGVCPCAKHPRGAAAAHRCERRDESVDSRIDRARTNQSAPHRQATDWSPARACGNVARAELRPGLRQPAHGSSAARARGNPAGSSERRIAAHQTA